MTGSESASKRWRPSWVDFATFLVLALAVNILLRQDSGVRVAYERWKGEREFALRMREHWPSLSAIATRLYSENLPPELIEFVDYECPFCRMLAPVVDSVVARGVRVAVVHMPLDRHPAANVAAQAALCAAHSQDFPRTNRLLLESTVWQLQHADSARERLMSLLGDARLATCLANGEMAEEVGKHLAIARALGIDATPRFISRERLLARLPSSNELVAFARGR